GFISTGIWGGVSAGPVLGQFLGTFERAAALQIITAIAAFILLSGLREHYEPHPHCHPGLGVPKWLLRPGLTIGFVNVHYPVVAGFLILHVTQHGGAGRPAFTAYAALVLVSRFFLGGLPDRVSPAITFYTGLGAMAVGIAMVAYTSGPVMS